MSRLVVRRLDAFYGDFQALFGISLEVAVERVEPADDQATHGASMPR